MDHRSRARRVGLTAIACALLLRLTAAGVPEKLAELLLRSNIASFFTEAETGHSVRFFPSLAAFSPGFVESPPPPRPEPAQPQEPDRPVFSGTEAVEMYYGCDLRPDLEALLAEPLDWDLTAEAPSVLILHTHTTEGFAESADRGWRSTEAAENMLTIGEYVARLLEEAGIGVVRDQILHDHPSYNGSYVRSRKTIREYLAQYPSLRLVLDLHRDAAGDGSGQLRTRAARNGQPCAQLMLVMGTNHENYGENLSLALKLHALLEGQYPGIMRPLQLRAQRFNQDLSPGALLVEVGAAGNTLAEALSAAEALAEGLIALARGTE